MTHAAERSWSLPAYVFALTVALIFAVSMGAIALT